MNFEVLHSLTNEPWGVRRFFVREPNGKARQAHPQALRLLGDA